MTRIISTVIHALDGRELAGLITEPASEVDIPYVAVIQPATATSKNLYRKFALFLSEQGIPSVVYDYRGTGENPVDETVRMTDWMLYDNPGAVRFMKQRYPDKPVVAFCHSVGAHGAYASFGEEPVDAIVSVASHAGITRLIPEFGEKARVWAAFNLITPLSAKFLGRVPVDRFGFGDPVPRDMVVQWSRWTRKPNYFFDDPEFSHLFSQRYQEVTAPVLSVVATDDLWATRKATDRLVDKLTHAQVTKLDIDPDNGPIGHMGFFRSKNKHLWPQLTEWVDQALP